MCGYVTLLLVGLGVHSCVSPRESQSGGIAIGAILPFTGSQAATGTSFERAIRMAIEPANKAGGVLGERFRVVARDTHSNVLRGLTDVTQLVDDEPVVAVIGPEEAELARRMVSLVEDKQFVQMLPSVTAPAITRPSDWWFRVAPASSLFGCALANRIYGDGYRSLTIIRENDDYSRGLALQISEEFTRFGGSVWPIFSLDANQTSFSNLAQAINAQESDSIVLIGYPLTSAKLVLEVSQLVGSSRRWYFGPSLRDESFVVNAPPGVLEGMVGIGAALPNDSDEFAQAFAERWDNETPVNGAFFYYDAAALVALATAAAAQASGVLPSSGMIRDHMREVAGPPGTPVGWEELGQGFELLRAGETINYRGASGKVDIDEEGKVPAIEALIRFWAVRGAGIEPEEFGVCPAG